MRRNTMRVLVSIASVAMASLAMPAQAMNLSDACARFASKLNAAVQAGNSAKAQEIYQVGSQRIANNFNGATCPNVQPPASSQ